MMRALSFFVGVCLLAGCASHAAAPSEQSLDAAQVSPEVAPEEKPMETRPDTGAAKMDLDGLDRIIRSEATAVARKGGVWEFKLKGVPMFCMTDTRFNRMRFIAPIARLEELEAKHIAGAFDANFHSALDARYATSDGIVFAAFIHPLSTLHEDDARSALRQVASLVMTFGSTYSSGELIFGGEPEDKGEDI